MNKLLTGLLVAASVSITSQALAQNDDDHGLELAPSIERIAGLSHATAKPDGENSAGATFFNVAGAVHDPLSMPRVGFDVFLPNGLGFGAALGFSTVSLSSQSPGSSDSRNDGSLTAYVFSPRISYRIPVSDYFDIVPRFGLTFLGGNVTDGDRQSCSFTGTTSNCATVSGDKSSVHATALSPEVVGVIRITTSFNILAGLSYDHVVSAGTDQTDSYTNAGGSPASSTSSNSVSGTFSAIHLWFGMGGYL